MSDCVKLNFDLLVARYGIVLTPNQAAEAVAAAVDGDALLEQVNRGRFPVRPKPTRPRGFVAYDLAKYLCGAYEAEEPALAVQPAPSSKATKQKNVSRRTQSVASSVRARREALGIGQNFAFRQVQGWQSRQDLRRKLRIKRVRFIEKMTEKYEMEQVRELAELNDLSVRAFVALKTILRFRQNT